MILLRAVDLAKSYGENEILREISLEIKDKEIIGLVGANGSGKTTLLKCLQQPQLADAGSVSAAAHLRSCCLEQLHRPLDGLTVWEAVLVSFTEILAKRRQLRRLEELMGQADETSLSQYLRDYARCQTEYELLDGYALESRVKGILNGLGLAPEFWDMPSVRLSGGEKTRLQLAALLVSQPDILYLDEPTNHLDIQAIEWLEGFLRDFPGSVLVISHDRRFLDNVTTRILELRQGRLRSFPGNYSDYLSARRQADASWEAAYHKQQEYIAQTEAYIRRFRAGIKAKQARGRQSQLDRLERIESPAADKTWQKVQFKSAALSGEQVLQWENLTKNYAGKKVLEGITGRIRRGEKIALLGSNGSGKTTLMRLFSGVETPDEGTIKWGSNVHIGYFSQALDHLPEHKTLLEAITDKFLLPVETARTYLGRFLFSQDQVFALIKDLSGGEKARLAFLELLLSGANFLLLDEPTNHLDIETQEVWEEILADFDGTILFVSHDRHFIDQLAHRVLVLAGSHLTDYPGNYTYYRRKADAAFKQPVAAANPAVAVPKRSKRNQADTKAKFLEQQLQELEKQIAVLEVAEKDYARQLSDPEIYNDFEEVRSVTAEYKDIQAELQTAMEAWELLQDQLLP